MSNPCNKESLKPDESKEHVLNRWLIQDYSNVARHLLLFLTEIKGNRQNEIVNLREVVRSHYVDPDVFADRIASLGAPNTAELFREFLPNTSRARSGDLGEILATEIAELYLNYDVPIRRLRWKDGRNRALYGDDILGISRNSDQLCFLKGESKSRSQLSSNVLSDAGSTLDNDDGGPSRLSVLFIASRLREQGNDDLALKLELAVLQSYEGMNIEHMLFVLCGGSPRDLLVRHLESNSNGTIRRYAVCVNVRDHTNFIEKLYKDL